MASDQDRSAVASAPNTEYLAVRQCNTMLIDLLAQSIESVGDALFSKGQISKSVRDDLRNPSLSRTDKVRKVVDCITDRIEHDSSVYKDFVAVLKEQGPWTDTIVEKLQSAFQSMVFNMLLIGETGSGKTSFLNLLYNCGTVQALGCGLGPEGLGQFRQHNDIKLENAQEHAMESKTSRARLYKVQLKDLAVGVIDTPGIGNSLGLKEDDEHVETIIDELKRVTYINCVCLIINGRRSRLTASLRYVLTDISAILPKEILDNVIVVFTNMSDPLDLCFDPKSLATYFGREVQHMFFIENPYCRLEMAKAKVAQLGIERFAQSLQKSFDDTSTVLDDIYGAIKNFQSVPTRGFAILNEKREEIEETLNQLLMAEEQPAKKKQLSVKLSERIKEFEKLGVEMNYAKLIKSQLAVIKERLEGMSGPETENMRETKEVLDKKLLLVQYLG